MRVHTPGTNEDGRDGSDLIGKPFGMGVILDVTATARRGTFVILTEVKGAVQPFATGCVRVNPDGELISHEWDWGTYHADYASARARMAKRAADSWPR